MTTRALAAKEQFQSECSVAGTRKLEGNLMVYGYFETIL